MNNTEIPMGGTELMYGELKRRLPEYFEKYSIFNYPYQADESKPLIYWNQLSYDQTAVQFLKEVETVDKIDKFVFVSHWQAEKFRQLFGIPGFKTEVIKNACLGVSPRTFAKKEPNDIVKICYTSTPWRGLGVLLRAWELNPIQNAELHIFSSTQIYGSGFSESEDKKYEELYEKCRTLDGVVYRGFVSNEELRGELSDFDILAYPNTFEETSCISVVDALSAGLRVITSNLGALPETTEGWARMYPFYMDFELHAQNFSNILLEEVALIRSGDLIPQLKRQVENYAPNWSWDRRENDWKLFFEKLNK